jgi:hypothetical protein
MGNESRVCSTALNSMHLEHVQFFHDGGILGTMYLQIPTSTVPLFSFSKLG